MALKKMITDKIVPLIVLLIIIGSCARKPSGILTAEKKNALDKYLLSAVEVHNIPGMALAVVKDDEIVYQTYLGEASIEEKLPVDDNTIFRIFSTTKLITATGIFQLVEKRKLSLQDKISKYVDSLPHSWQQVKVENLLTHSSGLPDLRYPASLSDSEVMKRLFEDKIGFQAGNQFRYNQTNYWLLAKIIEKVTGLSFEEYVLSNQFEGSEDGVLFSSDSNEEIPKRAIRYYYDPEENTFRKDTINNGRRGHPGNGLNISLPEFVRWNKRLNDSELMEAETMAEMWTPYEFANGVDKFLYGWGTYDVDNKTSYGFTGGNLSGFRKFVKDDMTIILLSNGYEHPGYDSIINDISRIVMQKTDEPKRMLEQDIMRLMLSKNYKDAKTTFIKLKEQDSVYSFDNLKWNINSIGNSFFRSDKIEEACSVYRLNAEVNTDWWVAQAGYAEGLEKKGDTAKASDYYQKAIRLNVNNEYDYNTFMTKKIEELKN